MHNKLLLLAALAGCAGANPAECRDDRDCGGGRVCASATCVPTAGGGDAGAGDGPAASADLAARADLRQPPRDLAGSDGPAGVCNFDNDGVITRAESPVRAGLGALYATNAPGTTVPVDVRPQGGEWDFSAAVSGERRVFEELIDPAGTWWSADFPSATYADRLDAELLVVYRATADSIELLGVVSEQDGLTRTRLTYATPIPVLRFPLRAGDRWTVASDVTGVASGVLVPFGARDTYAFDVDRSGTTRVPAGSFETLRLHIDYRQVYGLLTTTRITYIHVAECYGAVARIRSRDNERNQEFTQAAEYRRLAAP